MCIALYLCTEKIIYKKIKRQQKNKKFSLRMNFFYNLLIVVILILLLYNSLQYMISKVGN